MLRMGGLVLLISILLSGAGIETKAQCLHPLFCDGPLLELVQESHIFPDSKEFVDRPLLAPLLQVKEELYAAYLQGGTMALKQAVLNLTASPGSDLLKWEPLDWTPRPLFIECIEDSDIRAWAYELNNIWRNLGRQVSPLVATAPELHSLLPQPHPFVVPGGHFRESYYWDSYWIIQGLLLGQMEETARHMLDNMAALIHIYGFVPNGGRIYYTARSQPPLLTQMVALYYNYTSNLTFVESLLPALSREYDFWMTNRSVNLTLGTVNLYNSPTDTPRPESYAEDTTTASQLQPERQGDFFSAIASAAESGWDFSSRWLESTNISSIKTQRIIPVDLNAILCHNELTLHHLYTAVGDTTKAQYFLQALQDRERTFDTLFWNESRGMWLDRDLDTDSHLTHFYASSLVPLLWGCGLPNSSKHEATLETMQQLGLLDYPGGIPASSVQGSDQQWDFPNAWAPHQWFPVSAWTHSAVPSLRQAARKIAKTWIISTHTAWIQYNNTMFDKYVCTMSGTPAAGGEYTVQSGFGWTNAVVLYFLSLYPDLVLTDGLVVLQDFTNGTVGTVSTVPPHRSALGWIAVPVLALLLMVAVFLCAIWGRWLYTAGETRYWGRVHNEHLQAAGGDTSSSQQHQQHQGRDSSEETDENVDSDKKELFSWNLHH